MTPGVWPYLAVGIVAAVVTWLTVPLTQRVAARVGAIVAPDERRVHQRPTPTLGGAAMLVGFVAAVASAWFLVPGFDAIFDAPGEIVGIVVAATVMYAVGLVDDLRDVSAPAKVAGMVLAGSVLSIAGVSLVYFRIPFAGFWVLDPNLSALVTVLWVIGMANAINLIDGLDGLAAGIVTIAAVAFFVYTMRLGESDLLRMTNPAPLVAIGAAGACFGFLPHNIHPARTFMGDGGALLLGLLMAAATISVGGRTRDPFSGQTFFFFAPLVIPLFILGVPIIDTSFAMVRRARHRSGMATADKRHLHHRLMEMGHGQRRSVAILWGWTAVLSAMALYPTFTGRGDGLVVVGLAAVALALVTWFHPGVRGRNE